jgi:hypothetical protein
MHPVQKNSRFQRRESTLAAIYGAGTTGTINLVFDFPND